MTRYAGLKYEGMAGYLISMLQVLFCTTAFRKLIYEIPMTGSENPATSFILCLQRLFSLMQFSDQVCSMTAFAKSFGWDEFYTRVGHDVSEFMRTMRNQIGESIKGTPLEGRIAVLFRGKRRFFVGCPGIDFKSYREEEFYDMSSSYENACFRSMSHDLTAFHQHIMSNKAIKMREMTEMSLTSVSEMENQPDSVTRPIQKLMPV
jgi:hypothetical protein